MSSAALLQDLSKQGEPQQGQGKSSLDALNEVAADPTLADKVVDPNAQRTAQLRQELETSGAIPKAHRIDFSKEAPGVQAAMTQPIPKPIAYAMEAAPFLTGVGEAGAVATAGGVAARAGARYGARVAASVLANLAPEKLGEYAVKGTLYYLAAKLGLKWLAGK